MTKKRLSGLRACLQGGNANNGDNAGFSYLNTNNSASIPIRNCDKEE